MLQLTLFLVSFKSSDCSLSVRVVTLGYHFIVIKSLARSSLMVVLSTLIPMQSAIVLLTKDYLHIAKGYYTPTIVGYHFSFRLTATLNLCLIYFKITCALTIQLEHMHKKFEINWTKIKGGCQWGRKVVTHNSKSVLPLITS